MSVLGTVYLIHIDGQGLETRPGVYAKHYLGWSADHEARMECHAAGRGSRLMAAVKRAGLDWRVVKTWDQTDRHWERRLKNLKNGAKLCPVCVAERRAAGANVHLLDPARPTLAVAA